MNLAILLWIAVGSALFGFVFLALPAYLNWRHPIPDRGDVDKQKTRLETEDLRYGWMRTLGTAVLTASVAVGGWYLQQDAARQDLNAREKIAANDRAQRDALADRDTLARYVGDLGDANAGRRLAAVSYVGQKYIESGDSSRRLIDVLIYRFSTEADPRIQDYIGQTIYRLPSENPKLRDDVIAAVVEANRQVARGYARAIGTVVGESLGAKAASRDRSNPFTNLYGLPPDDRDVLDTVVSSVNDATAPSNATLIDNAAATPVSLQFNTGLLPSQGAGEI
ncbi:MAG TPA: hypothetical protein VK665_12380, partial [Candidatus Elarobacter sp.]|nr:hypothetical protein [Candidatus Elarobacter sp.]